MSETFSSCKSTVTEICSTPFEVYPELATIRNTASDMLKKHADTCKMHYEHDGKMWDVEVRVLNVKEKP